MAKEPIKTTTENTNLHKLRAMGKGSKNFQAKKTKK